MQNVMYGKGRKLQYEAQNKHVGNRISGIAFLSIHVLMSMTLGILHSLQKNSSQHRIADKGLTEMLENTNLSLHHPRPRRHHHLHSIDHIIYTFSLQIFLLSSLHTQFFCVLCCNLLDNYILSLVSSFFSLQLKRNPDSTKQTTQRCNAICHFNLFFTSTV